MPDKNAAAQRVVGIAKGLREIGFEVIFVNLLKNFDGKFVEKKNYYGFKCIEYGRKSKFDYLISARTILRMISQISPDIVIAYNYPAISLNKIYKYCKKESVKCYADCTEWYLPETGNPIYQIIKIMDSSYRMRYVHKKLDGIITISRFLYDYYKKHVNAVIIPPTVDITDEKWNVVVQKDEDEFSLIYVGSPSVQKERMDLIVDAIEKLNIVKRVRFNIVGITKEQFIQMYGWRKQLSNRIVFWGNIEHKRAIELLKSSDWAIIIRENNYVVNAGFPTKLVESISCGIPVIVNEFSNVKDFLNGDNAIIVDIRNIEEGLLKASKISPKIDNKLFDFHNFIGELIDLVDERGY